MLSCPDCRLLLENVEWHGAAVLACRSCGGTWHLARDLNTLLTELRADLADLNARYPGVGSLASFSGLSAPCPQCGAELASIPLALAPEQEVRTCPSCGGVWLNLSARANLSSSTKFASRTDSDSFAREEALAVYAPPTRDAPQLSEADQVLAANAEYSRDFKYGHMPREPKRHIAVLTCMDSRMRIYEMLGMEAGDLNVIRNAGGIVTEDALRSLIVSHHLLGTREIFVINHTDCGLLAITDSGFRDRLVNATGASSAIPATFHAFSDLKDNVREQIRRLRSHPWIPASVRIRGFVYDVRTGTLDEVFGR